MTSSSGNPSPRKRSIVVAFRLTETEAARIQAAAAGLIPPRSRSDFCRAIALHAARLRVPGPVKPIRLRPRNLPALDVQLLSKTLAEVGKLGSNINQLARVAHINGAMPSFHALAAMARIIAEVRDEVGAALRGGSGAGVSL